MNRHWNDRVKCWSQQDKLIVDNCPVPWCVLAITANLFMYTSLDKYYKLQSNWRPSGDNIVYKEREIIFGIHIKFVSLKWNVDIRLFPLEHPPPFPIFLHLNTIRVNLMNEVMTAFIEITHYTITWIRIPPNFTKWISMVTVT